MHTLSTVQALSIWTDLEQALRGEHAFGGDVAEIYIYRLLPAEAFRPGGMRVDVVSDKLVLDAANESFHDLLLHFQTTRHASIDIQVWDGPVRRASNGRFKELGAWLRSHGERHRFHVRVRGKQGEQAQMTRMTPEWIARFADATAHLGDMPPGGRSTHSTSAEAAAPDETSETTNIDKVRASAKALLALLDVNETGCSTWHDAVAKRIDEIAALSAYKAAVDEIALLLGGRFITPQDTQAWRSKYVNFTKKV
jgi:hypothetical protein